MKKILVPTDFSACAANASAVAIQLAQKYHADLHFYSCLDIRANWETLPPEEQADHPEAIRQVENANLLMEEWIEKAKKVGVEASSGLGGGNLVKNIKQLIQQRQIDFIVMGSHGTSGKSEYFIGSNTYKVIKTIHIPVMVIKEKLTNIEFKNVVFASDFDPKETKPFQYFLEFLKPFTPMIHLLEVNTHGWFSQPYALAKELIADFAKMCPPLKCQKYFYRDYSIDAGIRHFAEEVDADLIVISNFNQHPIRRIFQGSSVEAIVNHARRPVLCVDIPKDEHSYFYLEERYQITKV